MPNAFDLARKIEAESRRILEPMLELHTNGRYVYTDKGPLAKEIQKKYGDLFINMASNGEINSIELKAEKKPTGNLFLEFWSNGSRYNLGWMLHSDADLLFYHILDSDELYILPMQRLKKWFWFGVGPKRSDGTSRLHKPAYLRFEARRQNKYEQMNDTWGCCVPVSVIKNEVGLKLVNPLGLFGIGEAIGKPIDNKGENYCGRHIRGVYAGEVAA